MSTSPIVRHLGGDEYEIESTSGATYFMHADACTCTCKNFQFRCKETPGAQCKHLKLLAEVLSAARACPFCQGKGVRYTLHAYRNADGTVTRDYPCAECLETGRRDVCDPAALREVEEVRSSLPSQEELLKIFA